MYRAFNKGFKLQIKEFKWITLPGYNQMYTSVHSDVSQESYSFDLLYLPLDVPFVWVINQGYMAYVSLWIPLIWVVKVLH